MACWQIKALLAISILVLFCVPYFLIGNFPLFPVRRLPLTPLDRTIGFHPYAWVWIYQSVYLFINIVPWLAASRDELRKYAVGFASISACSFAVFILFPIHAPKPVVTDASGMYGLLLTYDVSLNSLPSLHASLLVYTFCFGRRIFRGRLPVSVGLLSGVWMLLILYGTLATKEHYLLDIVTGAFLAIAVDRLIWRRSSDSLSPSFSPAVVPHPAES